jgi:hypothetical protein
LGHSQGGAPVPRRQRAETEEPMPTPPDVPANTLAAVVGVASSVATLVALRALNLDRRTLLFTLMIIIATLYVLFATIGGGGHALIVDASIAAVFVALAILGARYSAWLLIVAIGLHGVMDFVHGDLVSNAGVPAWWPAFCGAYDVSAALIFALAARGRGSDRASAPVVIAGRSA